jgi:hypothetical protein
MPRFRFQQGWAEEIGKKAKKWRGHFFVYVQKPDSVEQRKHRIALLGTKSDMRKFQTEKKLKEMIEREIGEGTAPPDETVTLNWFWEKRWVGMSCAWQHAAELEKSGIPRLRLGLWHKPNGAPQFTGGRQSTGWDAIAILHREGEKSGNSGDHRAVWVCNVEHSDHPAPKPLKLLVDWVVKFTDEGGPVLDPFCGSVTTGVITGS